jgi:hypothetical protein
MAVKGNSPYIPSFLKSALSDTRPVQLTFLDLVGTNIKNTGSFKYDPLDSPLKNTQQINVDWSKFENHTFFSSAEVKVNIAFDQIINGFPFDGTKKETEAFFEKIGGFEKWVFDQFPKFGGALHFSGTQVGENPSNGFSAGLGTWISVQDTAGWLYPELSKNKSGKSVLNPPTNQSFTIEAHVFIPSQANDNQIVIQKLSPDKTQGFTFFLSSSVSTSHVTGTFSIISGSVENSVSALLTKGKYNHVCLSLNRETGNNYLQFFIDEVLANESFKEKRISDFNDTSNLLIGSGSSFYVDGSLVNSLQTFSGSLDELRIFHSYRSPKQQKLYASKGIHSSDSLKLYFRFNEPPVAFSSQPGDAVNSIVLDSSGNSLHSLVSNFTSSLRRSSKDDPLNPMIYEKDEFKTVLFPLHPDIVSLNENLLASASLYDEANPNLITKLIPRHYLREGALQEGLSRTNLDGTIGDNYGGEGIPGQGQMGSTQIMLTFLYIWSKFFDEIKMFVDAFKTLRTVDYNLNETLPDNFLNDFVRAYGFYLPPLFNNSNIQQYVEAEDIVGISVSDYALKEVQAQLLRRVLINMPDVLRSKGTQHSIRSFLRAIGINPDSSLRIREFGGPSTRQLGTVRETKSDLIAAVDFTTGSSVMTPYLSASRIEPGYPNPVGPITNGVSSNASDGLLTSGSWTLEGLFRYGPKNIARISDNQSLMRLEVTGSSASAKPGLIANVVPSGSMLNAYFRPGISSTSPVLKLTVSASIFDGDRWSISIGCDRSDSIDSVVSSSYFLRAATQNVGDITQYYATSSLFEEAPGTINVFREINSTYNASGSWIAMGNQTNIPEGVGLVFLNNTLDAPDEARASEFVGQASNIRFWSKGITEQEWREHIRNYKSTGVTDPLTNYNYVKNKSGSFERLRLSSLEKQNEVTASSGGSIQFLDFSENSLHFSGSGFPSSTQVFVGDILGYSYLSPYFDEYSTSEKVRIRSFQNEENLIDSPWASFGTLNELPPGEMPLDDPRLSIEFSLIDSLNRDMINMFATLDALGNAVGSPELMFSPDYPDLENLRDVYFNRVKEKLNFRGFFEFYRWFDTSIGTFIEQLVPRKTRFKGTNFVIESHMLERHKIEYKSSEIYLGDSLRSNLDTSLLLQLISGIIKKY